MTNRVKRMKPAKNGRHTGNSKPVAHESLWVAPFGNYAGDVPLQIDQICDSLLALTDGWPKCVSGVLCFADGEQTEVLEDAAALFAWIGGHAQVEWKRGARAVTKEEFFKRLHQRERWAWATPHPHFPPVDGVLYLAKAPKAKNTGKLDELVARFRPKSWVDRELIKAMILTFFWGGPPGKRPHFVIAADEAQDPDAGRGTGKTTLPQYLSELVGGCVDIDPSDNRNRLLSNLLSPTCFARRIALVDNLKSARFSHDLVERLITRSEITGHRLYRGFAHRPNLLVWITTVNGAFFSTDMAQRSIVLRIERPTDTPQDWDAETLAFIRENRDEIVADVRWHLEVKRPTRLTKVDRWGPWCLGVLSRCKKPNQLLAQIGGRRAAIDADKEEVALALDHLRACLTTHFDVGPGPVNVDGAVVWVPTAWLVQALRVLKRDFTDRQAQQFLARLTSSPLLRRCNRNTQRGYLYVGKRVDPDHPPPPLEVLYRPDVPSADRRRK